MTYLRFSHSEGSTSHGSKAGSTARGGISARLGDHRSKRQASGKRQQWSGGDETRSRAALGAAERSRVTLVLSSVGSSRSSRRRSSQGGAPLAVPAAAHLGDEGYPGGANRLGIKVQLLEAVTPGTASTSFSLPPSPSSSLLLLAPALLCGQGGGFGGRFSRRAAEQGEETGGSIYRVAG
jgi:hypothetical protein